MELGKFTPTKYGNKAPDAKQRMAGDYLKDFAGSESNISKIIGSSRTSSGDLRGGVRNSGSVGGGTNNFSAVKTKTKKPEFLSKMVTNHYTAYRDKADRADNKLAGGHGDSWSDEFFRSNKMEWLTGGYDNEIDITDEKYAGNKLKNEDGEYYTYGDNPLYKKDKDGYWNTIEDQQRRKDDLAKKEQENSQAATA